MSTEEGLIGEPHPDAAEEKSDGEPGLVSDGERAGLRLGDGFQSQHAGLNLVSSGV